MSIANLWKERKKPTLTFEYYPPNDEKGSQKLDKIVDTLAALEPDFASVTFGAGGSTREGSYELVKKFKQEKKFETVGYVAAYGLAPTAIRSILDSYRALGVENIFCIRGDKPQNIADFQSAPDSFSHASDFIKFAQENYSFVLGGAGYPEGHFQAESKEKDLEYLKLKVDMGAQFIISQTCFDTQIYIDFVQRCRKIGINVPILAGIMPIYTVKMLENLAGICGATITPQVRNGLAQLPPDDKEAVLNFGIDFAEKQCRELLKYGVDGIHFYTLNRSATVLEVVQRLRKDGLI